MEKTSKPKIRANIAAEIEDAPNGTLFFSNSFPMFGDEYVGHVLSDLVAVGIRRIGRGVYLKTKATRYGLVYPSVDEIANAIAKRDGAEVLPTGAMALNILGLSTQVPLNPTFITSGSARVVEIGGRKITFKRGVPRNFNIKGKKRSLIVQALKAIGEKNLTEEDLASVKSIIQKYPEPDNYNEDLKVMPVWIRRIFQKTDESNRIWEVRTA